MTKEPSPCHLTMSVHVIQVYPSLPADMSCVIWESTGPAVYGVFVPVSNASLNISEPYGKNQSAEEVYRFDTDNYPYYRIKEINTLCVENDTYEIYGLPTRGYWHDAESRMTSTMKTVLENASQMESDKAHKYITGYCDQVQEYAFEDAGNILNDIRLYMSDNSNTLKQGVDPETHKVIDALTDIKPMTIKLDAKRYENIPAVTDNSATRNIATVLVVILMILAVALTVLRINKDRRKRS